ncbi:uncharacterized protein LOC127002576 [Eriocheir sinensis]|uniref:uncharacterized protein LOC127002576 n=1 Tax=Eriocheir sinensis TaxID=95602 RepID=UPI0021C8CB6B|nr:uncharacterized protein LOC127002576 [Eriocheir sinensis]
MSLLTEVANNSINPKYRAVSHLHDVWLKENHGGLGGFSMQTAIEKYFQSNPGSLIEMEFSETSFAIALVTPLMQRIHQKLKESAEVVFVDTTSHVDQINTAVTLLLCAGPSGALPLGLIFTSSQEQSSFIKGFKLLKLALGGDGFYRVGHPNCFVTDNCDAERHALQSVWPESHLFLCVFHILQQIWRWLWDSHHGIKKDDRQRLMAVAKQLVYSDSEETFNSIWTSFNGSEDAQTYSRYCSYLSKLFERRHEWSIWARKGFFLRGHNTNNFAESTICIVKDVILNRCKAYNTTQLVVYMNEIFENYVHEATSTRCCSEEAQSQAYHDYLGSAREC